MTRDHAPVGRPGTPGPRSTSTNRLFRAAGALLLASLTGGTSAALSGVPGAVPLQLVSGQWTWNGGASVENDPGVPGTLGVPAPGNLPAARTGSASWTDADGNRWLFGGIVRPSGPADSGYRNDLWKLDVATGLWSRVSGLADQAQLGSYGTMGIAAPSNVPGARSGAASWTGADGGLYLFGGMDGTGWNVPTNDLWKFDPATRLWTWVGGTNRPQKAGVYGTKGLAGLDTVPGARADASSWVALDGTFWLFGGVGYGSSAAVQGSLNDAWRWNPVNGRWAWYGGSSDVKQPGTYGAKGTPAADNTPGGRSGSSAWSDGRGGLWLFGGNGYAANGSKGRMNDLWKWNASTMKWAWISGSSAPMPLPTYGTLGVPAARNVPGGREGTASWVDSEGNFWLFGGLGLDENTQSAEYGDLWKYDVATGLWTWMGGSSLPGQPGTYGTKGIPSAATLPGARDGALAWTDQSGNFWLFGGAGWSATGTGSLNDLWVFANPNAASPTECTANSTALCLLGGRFRVSVDWADYGGGKGQGRAAALTPDTGTFWFQSAANLEVVAKMVSFCGGGSDNVAVYATGLTDLDVTLHVTDTRSGATRDYRNPLGTPFSLVRDGPFGCPAGAAPPLPGRVAAQPAGIVETASWQEPPSAEAACIADGNTLCLLDGRFQLRTAYRTYGGATGKGTAVPLTADTGTFWFFDQSNVEVVAKMVSFCGSGTNNVGIYAGGLTDIEVTLSVVDTATGLTRTYTNPLGTPFQLVRDGPFVCR